MSRDLTECPDCGMAYEWHDAEKCFHIQKSKLQEENKKIRECLIEVWERDDLCDIHRTISKLITELNINE